MQRFTDNAGRVWVLDINVATVRRVQAAIGVNLMSAVDGKLFGELADNPVLLCDVLWALIAPAAVTAGVTDEQFGAALAGDAIDHATVAFMEELVSFFPEPRRSLLRRVIEKLRQAQTLAGNLAGKRIDAMDLAAAIERQFAALPSLEIPTPGSLSGSAPASSASTPALTR